MGSFTVVFSSLSYCYDWFNWWKLLEKSKEYEYGFTTFGGWQYDDGSKVCKTWHMQPMVFSEVENKLVNLYVMQEKVKPVIPIKIRFWRK